MSEETKETKLLLLLLAIFNKLVGTTQGMARYQHAIFVQTSKLIVEGKELIHSQAAVAAFIERERLDFVRRSKMPPLTCRHCNFDTSYDIMAGAYPTECAACAAPLVQVEGEEMYYDISEEERIAIASVGMPMPEPASQASVMELQQSITAMAAKMEVEPAPTEATGNTVRKA
jgi:hypothetical protein